MIIKIMVAAMLFAGCSGRPNPAPTEEDAELKRQILAAMVNQVLLPTLAAFEQDARALEAATAAWLTAQQSGNGAAERNVARTAFRQAFIRWQRAEMMSFGPAGATQTFRFGQGLRDTIYAWPTVNDCRVDTVLAERQYVAEGFFDSALVTATGLAALERLLFYEAADNACAASSSINTSGLWASLSVDELALRRAEYGNFAASAIVRQAQRLQAAWADDAAVRFTSAGLEGSGFATAQAALDEVFAAFLDGAIDLKNARLGAPSGLWVNACAKSVCPELAEARLSQVSHLAVIANIEALQAIMKGDFQTDGHGFDALLNARGAAALTQELNTRLETARTHAAALPGPIDDAVVDHLGEVTQLHTEIKDLVSLLKTQFVTVLSLTIPAEGAGDAD